MYNKYLSMKRIWLLIFFCSITLFRSNDWISASNYHIPVSELEEYMQPSITFADGIMLLKIDETRSSHQYTTRDVVLKYPDGKIFAGAINIVKKDAEKAVISAIDAYYAACDKDYRYLHITEPLFPDNAFWDLSDFKRSLSQGTSLELEIPFPYTIVIGYICDTLGCYHLAPKASEQSLDNCKNYIYGQWGKEMYQEGSAIGLEFGLGCYTWNFKSDGTGSIMIPCEIEAVAPQVEVASMYNKQNNTRTSKTSGGYNVHCSTVVTINFSWKISDNNLILSYKSYSYTPIASKPIIPPANKYATKTFYQQLVAYIKSDFPHNKDAIRYKANFAEIIKKEKQSFVPTEVILPIVKLDKDVIILSGLNEKLLCLPRNRVKGTQSMMTTHLVEMESNGAGIQGYQNVLKVYLLSLLKKRQDQENMQLCKNLDESLLKYYKEMYNYFRMNESTETMEECVENISIIQEKVKCAYDKRRKAKINHINIKEKCAKDFSNIYRAYKKQYKSIPNIPYLETYDDAYRKSITTPDGYLKTTGEALTQQDYINNVYRQTIAYIAELEKILAEQQAILDYIILRNEMDLESHQLESLLPKELLKYYAKSYMSLSTVDKVDEYNERINEIKNVQQLFKEIYERRSVATNENTELVELGGKQYADALKSYAAVYKTTMVVPKLEKNDDLTNYVAQLDSLKSEQQLRKEYIGLRKAADQLNGDLVVLCASAKNCKRLYSALYKELSMRWDDSIDNIGQMKTNIQLLTSVKEQLSKQNLDTFDQQLKKVKKTDEFKNILGL